MKPLTPRMRMRFITAGFFSFLFWDFDFEEAQDFTIPAGGEPFAAFPIRASVVFGRNPFFFSRTKNLQFSPFEVGERPGKGRRNRAHEVVDLGGAPRPVDAAVLGRAAPVVTALG